MLEIQKIFYLCLLLSSLPFLKFWKLNTVYFEHTHVEIYNQSNLIISLVSRRRKYLFCIKRLHCFLSFHIVYSAFLRRLVTNVFTHCHLKAHIGTWKRQWGKMKMKVSITESPRKRSLISGWKCAVWTGNKLSSSRNANPTRNLGSR